MTFRMSRIVRRPTLAKSTLIETFSPGTEPLHTISRTYRLKPVPLIKLTYFSGMKAGSWTL